jgi:hypothetical protein
MQTTRLISTLILVIVGLSACGPHYPLGIAEEQWLNMNTEQRLQAQEKQAELNKAKAERQAAEARAREAEATRQRIELETRRREARYGERVQCVLSKAEVKLGGKWRDIEPVAVDLVQGMELAFNLTELGKSYRTQGYAQFDGQSVDLCRDAGGDRRNSNYCASVLGTTADFQRGINQHIDSPNFLRGHLHCDLMPAQGMPKRHDYR